MTVSTSDYLLPVGQELPVGTRRLLVEQRLGKGGLTGEVYRGTLLEDDAPPILVAAKAMKPLSYAMARQLFDQESETLALMQAYEQEAAGADREPLRVAPSYYGRGSYGDTPFLIMEFISGVEVPKLLANQPGGRMPEHQALLLGWHLYRTLDIMHTRLRKTYIDLKFENLWWVGDEEGTRGQLKLTDFGTLEEIKDGNQRGVRRDLLLGGVFLLSMLTGYTLNYSLGSLREHAEPIVRRFEGNISWGTQHLLERLLHRHAEVRPSNAATVATELRILSGLWRQELPGLLRVAQANLDRAQADPMGATGHDHASRARAALDIARRRGYEGEEVERLEAQATAIMERSSHLERGRVLLHQGDFSAARAAFREGLHWSANPARLRRWIYLTDLLEEHPQLQTDEALWQALQQVLKQMEDDEPGKAAKQLQALPRVLHGAAGCRALQADAQMFIAIRQAESKQSELEKRGPEALPETIYGDIAGYYRRALKCLEALPDSDFIRREEVDDWWPLVEKFEQRDRTAGEARRRLAELRRQLALHLTGEIER